MRTYSCVYLEREKQTTERLAYTMNNSLIRIVKWFCRKLTFNELASAIVIFLEVLNNSRNDIPLKPDEKPVRLVGYRINGVDYWIATDRKDLTSEQIAKIYKLRWDIENFFAWWKRHLRVYHLIARSEYGLMVQILGGLITYLLLTIYCHKNYGEPVSIKRVRQLRILIQNELRDSSSSTNLFFFKEQKRYRLHARI